MANKNEECWLITLQTQCGMAMHGYLMAKQAKHDGLLGAAIERMSEAVEKLGLPHLNLWLSTGPMPKDRAIEDIIRKHSPKAGEFVDNDQERKSVAFVAWLMKDDDPDNETLMAMH